MQKFAGELAPAAERLRAEVAERKKVEQALRASEEQHKRTSRMMELALETGKAFAWNVNLETGELFWNEVRPPAGSPAGIYPDP